MIPGELDPLEPVCVCTSGALALWLPQLIHQNALSSYALGTDAGVGICASLSVAFYAETRIQGTA